MDTRFGLALLLPLFALAAQWLLWPWIAPLAWFLFFPAVFFSARLGGERAGLISALLSAAIVWYFFLPPQLSVKLANPQHIYSVALFLILGWLISNAEQRLRRARQRTEAALAEADADKQRITELYHKTLELDELKSRFFANVSHELRTPLTLILSPLQRRLASPAPPAERRETEMMLRSARHLYHHVSDLLDISRLEAGHMAVDYSWLDMVELVQVTGAQFDSLARDREISFSMQLPAALEAEVDGEKVQRILLNLLSNAFKFTPAGGKVLLRLYSEGGKLVLEVDDSGPGVPPAQREAVFERFRQIEDSAGRHHGGTGLGLAIVREFALLHGGEAAVGEAPAGGARFQVRLPLHAATTATRIPRPLAVDPLITEDLLDHSEPDTDPGAGTAGSHAPLLLLIEDNADLNAYLRRLLQAWYRVESAGDGQSGVEKAQRLHPDLILCDVMMPGQNGEEVVQALRRQPALADTPIVMLTARIDDAMRLRLLTANVQDFITKPFDEADLLARIHGLVRSHRRQDEQLRASESRFVATFEQAAVGIALIDTNGRWLRVNQKLCDIVGYSREELEALTFLDITCSEDSAASQDCLRRMNAGEIQMYALEKRYVHREGEIIWVNVTVSSVRNRDGLVDYFIAVIEDIRPRKQAEAALRDSESRFVATFEQAAVGIALVSTDGHWLRVNNKLCDILGYSQEELLERNFQSVTHPDYMEADHQHLHQLLAGEIHAFTREKRYLHRDGHAVWCNVTVSVVNRADGAPRYFIAVINDISRRKQTEAALEETRTRFEATFEQAALGMAMVSREGHWLHVNRRFAEIVGYSPEEIAQLDLGNLTHPDDLAHDIEQMQRLLAGDIAIYSHEKRYVHKQGHSIWVHITVSLVRKPDGSPDYCIGTTEDITERRQMEAALRQSQQQLKLFIDHAPAAIAMFDRDMRYLAISQRWLQDYEKTGQDLVGRSHYDIFPEIDDDWKKLHQRCLAGETLREDEDRFERADGKVQWLRWEIVPWHSDAGSVGGILIFTEDITRQKQATEQLQQAASVFTHAREGIILTAPDGSIIDVNGSFTRITGYSHEEVVGRNPRLLQSGRQNTAFYHDMWRILGDVGHWTGEVWNRRKNGELFAEALTISAVHDDTGTLRHYVGLFSDISQIKAHEQQLEQMAHYDALTGLPNRVLLADRLRQAMALTPRRQQKLAVAYLDLDAFKTINDQHGHAVGDKLLALLATRMQQELRESDTLARLGGDEFAAVLLDLDDIEACVPLLARLLEAVSLPVRVGELDLLISASIGVTFYPQADDVDADQLLRQADQAMYQAKLAGKRRYHIFDPDQDRSVRGHHESIEQIRRALLQQQFVLHYQPKVNMRTGAVLGAEALIRWQHPQRGLLAPAAFLPCIEGHPLAVAIGEWAITTALSQIERWRMAGLDLPVSVNIGALQLQHGDFAGRLRSLLAEYPGVDPSRLELEVLETSALQDVAQTSQIMHACCALGVSFALDDFGTGYSSLTYLKRLPAAVLKIDQSFVRDMLDDPDDLAILEGVLALATAFGRSAIAEGVESVDHGLILLRLGCEHAQGYAIAAAMPAADFPAWAAAWQPDPRWTRARTVSAGNRPLLYARAEHNAWINAVAGYLGNDRPSPPALDSRETRFGSWLDTEAQTPSRNHQVISDLHRQVHDLATLLCEQHGSSPLTDVQTRLDELRALRTRWEEQLEQLLEAD